MAQDCDGGKYFFKSLNLEKCKLGYYELEEKDKELEEEEESIRTKKLRLKYKGKDFKEACCSRNLRKGTSNLSACYYVSCHQG